MATMLKLTMAGPDARPIYVNPERIACVYPRTVRDAELDQPRLNASGEKIGTTPGFRVEGCFITFGTNGDDADQPVMEPAEVVASFTADANDTRYFGLVDVAHEMAEIARREAVKAEARTRPCPECGKVGDDCECLPF